jgi:DNA-binding MarR family transcriptional regulator
MQGYLERNRDTTDWRSVWVKSTDKGKRALFAYDQARLAALQQRFENLTTQEQASIMSALPALQRLVE